jgi:hypothetical protein
VTQFVTQVNRAIWHKAACTVWKVAQALSALTSKIPQALRPALTSCYASAMAAKKKSAAPKPTRDLLMAEYIYEFAYHDFESKINGRDDEIWDEETLITTRAAAALDQWKKDGGLRSPKVDREIVKAREKWEAAGKPDEGVWYKGEFCKFKPNGEFDLAKSRMFAEQSAVPKK